MLETKVALITGSAKRVGAHLAEHLHAKNMRIIVHYHHSKDAAQSLCNQLNKKRPDSAVALYANLQEIQGLSDFISAAAGTWGRLDVLINNAAVFDTSDLNTLALSTWESTLNINLTAPFFLSLKAAPYLKITQGCIINVVDIRAQKPLKNYAPYCVSKAGLMMSTQSLALEWAPHIRVNGIAPGVVLWPDQTNPEEDLLRKKIISRTPLKQVGTPVDIAKAAYFLIEEAPYITGQVIAIDGGRSLV